MEAVVHRRRRNRNCALEKIFLDRENPFECNDHDFFKRYRFTKEIAILLIEESKEDLTRGTKRGKSISAHLIVLVSLNILGSGNFQFNSGQMRFHNLLQPTVSRIFHQFLNAVCRKATKFLKFPKNGNEILIIKRRFYDKFGFPNVIGAIDGTQIQIQKPALWGSYTFVNRENVSAINVQAVCDADYIFADVVCRWPGSTHDSHICNSSALFDILHSETFPSSTFLLGDNGYPLDSTLLTSLLNANTEAEKLYNLNHKKTRKIIEMAFGVLKSRFRIIHASGGNLLYRVDKCVKIISACFILHNIATLKGVPVPTGYSVEATETGETFGFDETEQREVRGHMRQIMIDYFSNN